MKFPAFKLSFATLVRLGSAVLLVAAGAAFIAGCGGGEDEEPEVVADTPVPTPTLSLEQVRAYLAAFPTPTPTSKWPPGSEAPIARLVVPRLGINAPVNVRGVDANGIMQDPYGPWDVVWYDFSGRPGHDWHGNAIFSGHVDYIRVGPAVFFRVGELNPEDVIEVHLVDGTVYRYAVRTKDVYPAYAAPVAAITGPTAEQSVTLITCTGQFAGGEYNNRLVVRAERIG